MSTTVIGNDSKTKEFLEKIGKIIVLFNHLEFWVEFWIWEMISPVADKAFDRQEIGRRITNPLTFQQKIDLLSSLVTERMEKEKIQHFQKIFNDLNNCNKKRNDIIHSLWYIQYGNEKEGIPPSTHKFKLPRQLPKFNKIDFLNYNKGITIDFLEDYLKEIDEHFEKLFKFFSL